MGAWGYKTFDNDDASDWLYDLEETSDLSLIEETVKQGQGDYIEAYDGCNILAAAEIIAALKGQASNDLPEEAEAWIDQNKNLDIKNIEKQVFEAVDRVLSDNSELKELWQDSDDYEAWLEDVNKLKERLKAS
tara:strand:- start:57 stop:455 length:399 start_codon:yes stop_codon:yes gene_type:complete